MNLTAALSKFATCDIEFEKRGRTLNDFGDFGTDILETCSLKAFISHRNLESLSVNVDNAYGDNEFPVYIIGEKDISLNDTAIIDSVSYKVRSARFRVFAGFMIIIVRRISRRDLTS